MRQLHSLQSACRSTLLREEFEAANYFTISTLRRADFEPNGWADSVKTPPPFSRSALFVIGGALLLSSFASLTSTSPMTVSRAARYHLRISAIGLLFFTGEDYAACVIARSKPWGHRRLAASLLTVAVALQAALISCILTKDALGCSSYSCNSLVWLMTIANAGITFATAPKWVIVPRFALYGIAILTLPAVAYRKNLMSEVAEKLVLSDYLISV